MPPGLFQHYNTLYDVQLRAFKHALRIQPDTQQLLRAGESEGITLSEASASDVAPWIFKDLAIYDCVFGGSPERDEVFECLWDAWLPYRDRLLTLESPLVEKPSREQVDTRIRAWLGAAFRATNRNSTEAWDAEVEVKFKDDDKKHEEAILSPRALECMTTWHDALCCRVSELVGSSEGRDTVPCDVNPTFKDYFIILNQSRWREDGCLLCYRKDSGQPGSAGDEQIAGTTWVMRQLSVEKAVEKVMQAATKLRQ